MRENLATLGTLLDGKPFLLGRRATIADLAVFAQLTWMRRYAEARLLDAEPRVQDWLARLADVPAIAAALSA